MREPWYAGYIAGKGCSTRERGEERNRLILHYDLIGTAGVCCGVLTVGRVEPGTVSSLSFFMYFWDSA